MKTLLFTSIFTFIMIAAMGQTPAGFCTVIHQPCDSDGVLAVTVTAGMTPPLTFDYWGQAVHTNVNSLSDTLFAIQYSFPVVVISDNFGNQFYVYTGLVDAFEFHITAVNPVCPDTMATVEGLTSNSIITNIDWYVETSQWASYYYSTGNPINLPINNNYRAVATDTAGCIQVYSTLSDSMLLMMDSPFVIFSDVDTANCTNGVVSIDSVQGGVSPYFYQWQNGSSLNYIDNLVAGSYMVTISDQQGCSFNYWYYVPQQYSINVNCVTSHATCANNNGSSMAFGSGGLSPYVYQWDNGYVGQQISGLSGPQYLYVYATDANGCRGNGYAYCTVTTPITVSYSTTPTSCESPTGSITLTANNGTLPYTVDWNAFPAQQGLTISNLSQGMYSFTVTDAVGCKKDGSVYVSGNSTLNASINNQVILCPSNSANLYCVVYGDFPPYTFLWSNGDTDSICHATQTGMYYCTVTDNVGCTISKCATVYQNSPINIDLIPVPASCMYVSDGSITAYASGGTPPYTYSWSPVAGNDSIASGLNYGYYWCYVTDASGCHKSKFVYLDYNHANDSCYCTITGKVYVDANSNCLYENGETEVQNIMMHCPGYGYSFTDVNGVYSFKVPTGTYNISEVVQHIYPLALCQINPFSVSVVEAPGCSTIVNFANVINPLHDIKLYSTSCGRPVPGNEYNHQFYIRNAGTVNEANVLFGHRDDEQLISNYFSPAIMSQPSLMTDPGWYNNNSGSLSLAPGEWEGINLNFNVPTNIPIGTVVYLNDTVAYAPPMSNWLNDYTPWNNVFDTNVVVVGPYDPNFKEVSPHGEGTEGYIFEYDSILTYTIHFQNVGSYYAQNVYVLDTLDANLILSSLKPELSSHDCEISMTESGIVKFSFNDIYLPWKGNYGEFLSSGFVTYSVRKQAGLAPGTKIKNSASIIFDYNQPIYTNETVNTISWPASSDEISSNPEISVFPNPTSTDVYIRTVRPVLHAGLLDISGRSVKADIILCSDGLYRMNTENLAPGVYMIRCEFLTHESEFAVFCKE